MSLQRWRALRLGLGSALRACCAPACVACGIEAGDPVCPGCRADYYTDCAPRCVVCANRLPNAMQSLAPCCGQCLAQPRAFDAAVTLADYVAPIDAMVVALKFQARLDLGRAFGMLLAEKAATVGAIDGIVPLPLSHQRQRERGFNQAEEIARALALRITTPLLPRALQRVRHCPSQQGLGRLQRRANVRGAFLAPARLDGLHLALVDDVLTSGSTLHEAAASLKRAGARRVTALVVARTA